ncbi:hypothetical protein BJY04DRAFT_187211 [Aspergillus karnatakaensis]|uniref:Hsp70 family protein n=1 Tax=Aspergillus karnatakaensis TaxID=1810916 RepID=UPI003CCE2493
MSWPPPWETFIGHFFFDAMANLGKRGSRKRRRASTVVDTIPIIADTDKDVGPEGRSSSGSRPPDASSTIESPPDVQTPNKFIVGLDYGTTFSSVSYIAFDPSQPPKSLRGEQIQSVTDWPGAGRSRDVPEVPSESWYLNGKLYWGYGARQAIMGLEDDNLSYKNRIIQYAKLMIPENEKKRYTGGPREELRRTLFKARKDEKQVIKDYLREILKHTKKFLMDREEFTETTDVELVFCVPAGWPAKAIRCMQDILMDIVHEIKFGNPDPLFVLNEPEAAAACILEAYSKREHLRVGDVFMICDAGGGTVDTITYRVRGEQPFRIAEVVTPTGNNCGASYVNQALKKEAVRRITDNVCRSMLQGPSFEYVVEHDIMNYFEYSVKRVFDPAEGLDGDETIVVHGLKKDVTRRFGNSTMIFSRREIAALFGPSLDGITKLIHQQVNAAREKGLTVQRLLMVGGYSSSPVLRSHIKSAFQSLEIMYPPTKLSDHAISVSHGAVFRALNKSDGPRRIVQSNFGFLQIEKYSKRLRAHQQVVPEFNETDGTDYVHNVLDWVIKKDQVLKQNQQFRTRNWQTFKLDDELAINQQIWVSDFDNAEDHYKSVAKQNKGAEVLGILHIDLEEVRNEGLLEVKTGIHDQYYEIHYELGMEVDGRNLSVKLFCPPGGRCRAQTQLCITAAFIPGTE